MDIFTNSEHIVICPETVDEIIVFNVKTGSITVNNRKWLSFRTTTEIGWHKMTVERSDKLFSDDLDRVVYALRNIL